MRTFRGVFRLVLLTASSIPITGFTTTAQTTSSKDAPLQAPGLRMLTGSDAKRADELYKAVEAARLADRWDEAIAKAEELLALRTRAQGPKHFETASAAWNLKTLRRVATMPREDRLAFRPAKSEEQEEGLYAQGKYAQAQALFEKALEINRRLLTDDDPVTAATYAWLAATLDAQGKYTRAQTLFEKALEIDGRLLTDDHPNTASAYNNLALNLYFQGKYVQAQPLLEHALEIYRRLLTDDDPNTAATYNNLAMVLAAQGKYAKAQPLYERSLEIYRRLYTDDQPDTATAYNNLAANLNSQEKYAQAQPLFEKALSNRRRLLTDNHPDTAQSFYNLAMNIKAQGNYAEAQPLLEKALSIRRGLLTEDHPHVALSYIGVASNLDALTKYEEARPLYEKALEISRRLHSDNHPDTAESYKCLASNLKAQGRYAEAQPLYEKALEIYGRLLGDDYLETRAARSQMARNLDAQGKYLEVRRSMAGAVKSLDAARLRIAFTGLERVRGSKDPVHPTLAAVLARLGRPAEAWQPLEEGLGRGLLDELAARENRRLTPAERTRFRELTVALEQLDRLVETTPKNLDQTERAKRFEDLKRQRELASIALGDFQTKLVHDYGPVAGRVADLQELQAALAADAALVAWVDIAPAGPNAADADGEHWGVVVRSRGIPAWIAITGTGPDGLWTKDDIGLAGRVRTQLRSRPGAGAADPGPVLKRLRTQRLHPLANALGASADGLPPARG